MADEGPEHKADESLEDTALPPDSGRPKRAPPTIDLEPTSSETHPGPAEAGIVGAGDAAA